MNKGLLKNFPVHLMFLVVTYDLRVFIYSIYFLCPKHSSFLSERVFFHIDASILIFTKHSFVWHKVMTSHRYENQTIICAIKVVEVQVV